MKEIFKFRTMLAATLVAAAAIGFTSCSDDDDELSNKEHDGTLYCEWVEASARYYKDYYYFDSDGTGTHGLYDVDIDETGDEEDFTWYTVDDKYLYIDGRQHEYWCDGTELYIDGKRYVEKD